MKSSHKSTMEQPLTRACDGIFTSISYIFCEKGSSKLHSIPRKQNKFEKV